MKLTGESTYFHSPLYAMDLEYLEHSSEKEMNDFVTFVKQIILGKHLHS